MNIVLGFGLTETDFEKQEFGFVEQFVKEKIENYREEDGIDFCFTDDFAKELSEKLKERKDQYDKLLDEYKTATKFPDRYSTYYFDVLHNSSNLCVVFKFSHINRRHAMSPDGWAALLETKQVCYIDLYDYKF
ncbi:hypothetical protein M0R04_06425 [Candidatus Dojkabacteria bacterium]|jgi:hypothetical protein|nr:hypothetical protein [Candidatus Dojkabacteria bacterium]